MTEPGLPTNEHIGAESKSLTTGPSQEQPMLRFGLSAQGPVGLLRFGREGLLASPACSRSPLVALRVFPSDLREICAAKPSKPFR